MTPHGPGPVALAVVSAAERALSALSWREAAPIPVRQIAAAEASPGPGLCALWGRIPPLISACALLCISESDITMISSLSSMKLSAALIAGLVVVARGLNSEYGGFVHIANWGGAILDPPHDSKGWVLPGGGGPPADLAQAVCSFDNNCTTSDSNMPGAPFSGGPNMMMPSTCTLLRILTHQLFRPQCATSLVVAAIIQMEKWLHCANGLLATTVINTYALPPDVMHTTCLANPKCTYACVGMRLKNDESGGGILGKAGGWDGYFRLARPSACARDTCHCSRQMNRSRRPGPQLKTVN